MRPVLVQGGLVGLCLSITRSMNFARLQQIGPDSLGHVCNIVDLSLSPPSIPPVGIKAVQIHLLVNINDPLG